MYVSMILAFLCLILPSQLMLTSLHPSIPTALSTRQRSFHAPSMPSKMSLLCRRTSKKPYEGNRMCKNQPILKTVFTSKYVHHSMTWNTRTHGERAPSPSIARFYRDETAVSFLLLFCLSCGGHMYRDTCERLAGHYSNTRYTSSALTSPILCDQPWLRCSTRKVSCK
jgi:hypothetical protein